MAFVEAVSRCLDFEQSRDGSASAPIDFLTGSGNLTLRRFDGVCDVLKSVLVALVLLLLLSVLAGLGYWGAAGILSFSAKLPQHADAVVVLGGDGGETRYRRGRELLLAGFCERLVLIEPSVSVRKDALNHLKGVVIWDDVFPGNSWGEAQTTRAQMQAFGWKSVLVVSDPPHMLRLRYAWFSNFWGSDLSYTLIATNPPWWSAQGWWKNPVANEFVKSEVLKLGYYVLYYRFGLW